MAQEFEDILQCSNKELDNLMVESRESSWKNFGRTLKAYYPGLSFPSISVTGNYCAQDCLYCNKHYLKDMKAITEPKNLVDFAKKLEEKGGKGMLISGGYDENCRVPLDSFVNAIAKIKLETNLQVNVHTGLVDKEQANILSEVGTDVISFDLITDNDVINEVLRNGKTGQDYIQSYKFLVEAGLNVVPHICLGLYHGSSKGNFEALNTAIQFNPELIVFIGFIPTKGTPMENSAIIEPEILAKAMIYTRKKNPSIEQSLGCMRVRLPEYEKIAINTGINRIAVPKTKSLEYAKEQFNIEIEKMFSCCAI